MPNCPTVRTVLEPAFTISSAKNAAVRKNCKFRFISLLRCPAPAYEHDCLAGCSQHPSIESDRDTLLQDYGACRDLAVALTSRPATKPRRTPKCTKNSL